MPRRWLTASTTICRHSRFNEAAASNAAEMRQNGSEIKAAEAALLQ